MELFDSADSDDDRIASAYALKVNNEFAEKYDARKRGEELSMLKDKYGSDYEEAEGDEDDESTQYSSEDSEAEFVTPQVDAAILKMISRIRNKDADLYEVEANSKDFFDEEEKRLFQLASANKADKAKGIKKDKSKPVKLKDFQRTALLAGVIDDERDEPVASTSYLPTKTPAQSALDLRDETKAAFLAAVHGAEDGEGDDAGLLVKRQNGSESEDGDDQYRQFLIDALGEAELQKALALRPESDERKDRSIAYSVSATAGEAREKKRNKKKAKKEQGLASKHINPNGQTDDDFLRSYILNRGWLDKKSRHRPSYKEIVADSDEPAPGPSGANAQPLLEDSEDEFERAEDFETQYNFRYEEAEGNQLTTHGRDAADMQSVRKVDESRKQARQAAKDRKVAEKAERTEELKRMKSLKRQEILEKIAKIREVAGADDGFDFDQLDLEGEYDVDKHAKNMSQVFDDRFYENEAVDENGKPVWTDEINIDDIVSGLNKYDDAYGPGGEAYDPTEPGQNSKKSKSKDKKDQKRKRSKADESGISNGIHQDEPKANGHSEDLDPAEFDGIEDPEERQRRVQQYMDEYYKLDYEDMVGDQPTRFKYSQGGALNPAGTKADPYALSAVDILMATDAELNAYESLRRLAPYRSTSADRDAKKRKRAKELRRVISSRKWGDEMPEEGEEAYFARPKDLKSTAKATEAEDAAQSEGKKKRKGAKERKKEKAKALIAEAAIAVAAD